MPIAAHLLGPPLMVRDGVVYAAARGKKVWALFAYLVLSDRQPTRQQLIELLFPDAEDPAGALRWNLSELRRLLGGSDTVGSGNAVRLRLPEGSVIDVHVRWREPRWRRSSSRGSGGSSWRAWTSRRVRVSWLGCSGNADACRR